MKTTRADSRDESRAERSIYTPLFAFAAVTIGAIAAMWFALYGWLGVALYLSFAALCMTPAALAARGLLKQLNALDNRLRAAEHAIDGMDRKLNPEER